MAESASGETILFNIDGNIAGIRKQLAEVSKLSRQAGKQMATNLAGQLNAIQTALARTGTTAKAASGNVTGLVRQLNDVGVQAAAGTPPLMILIQQGEQLAFAFREAGGAAGVLKAGMSAVAVAGPVMAAVAPVVIALGVAWYALDQEVERSETLMLNAANAATAMQKAAVPLHQTLQDLEDQTRVANGEITANGLAAETQVETIKAQTAAVRGLFEAQRDAAEAEYRNKQGTAAGGAAFAQYQAANAAIDALNAREERAVEIATMLAEKKDIEGQKTEKLTKATVDYVTAAEREAFLNQFLLDLEAERASNMDKLTAATEAMVTASHTATESQLSDIEKVIDKRDDQLAALKKAYEEGVEAARISGLMTTDLDDAYWTARVEIATAANAEIAKLEEKAREDKKKADKQALDTALGLAGQMADYMAQTTSATYASLTDNLAATQAYAAQVDEYLTQSQRDALQEREAAQKAAAIRAFEINKGVQIAAAEMQGISAAVAAFNAGMQSAPGPAAPFVAAAFAAASEIVTQAQVASIASQEPAFHTGGLAPDESMARILPGEGVISKQGMSSGGREAMDRMNAGVSSGGDVYAITAYRHTAQTTRYERDRLDRNSPYMQEIAKGRAPGMRSL